MNTIRTKAIRTADPLWKTIRLTIAALGFAAAAHGNLFQPPEQALDMERGGRPIVRVNGAPILDRQVETIVRQLIAQQRHSVPRDRLDEFREALVRQALDMLIGRELLAQEAAREGIDVTREELNETIAEIRGGVPEGQTLEDILRAQGITRSEFESNLIRELRVNRMIERISADLPEPDEDQVAAFYAENSEQFDQSERILVRHILIGIMDSDEEKVRDVRRRKAEALRRQVVDGQDFANLAMLHSDDASRTQGGEVGFVARDRIQPALADIAFDLRENEVSSVVESPAGYHILQVLERQPARRIPLEEAQDQIRSFLVEQTREAQVQAAVSALREEAEIEFLGQP